jgi:hypothetical protein
MIDSTIFGTYMTAVADRTKSPLAPTTIALYYTLLSRCLSTSEFEAAAQRVFAEYHDFGFPPAAAFLAAAKRATLSHLDAEAVLRRIEQLSTYTPSAGMIAPNVGTVREALGDLAADAYGSSGGARLFADNETTRAIARRDFQKELNEGAAAASVEAVAQLCAPPPRLALGAGRASESRADLPRETYNATAGSVEAA